MKRMGSAVLTSLVVLVTANLAIVDAQAQKAPQGLAAAGEKSDGAGKKFLDLPQEFVECTGWHALCTASYDCQIYGDKMAACNCLSVDENHIVETDAIQDTSVKRRTLDQCTGEHPCQVDEAPVCKAIQEGQYKVDNVKYEWVSTFSYRGWCTLLQVKPAPCDPELPGYSGDKSWAVCDGAPCTENPDPSDPNKPLSCQCRVQDSAFLGTNGSCTGDNGGIMSSSPIWTWDFQTNSYRIALPGYPYVQGACAPLQSDPLPEPPK